MVKIKTIRFGEVEVAESRVIMMTGGILGFPASEKYVVLDHEEDSPFKWLQSVDEPDLAFAITDPLYFFPEYNIQIKKEELSALNINDVKDLVIFVILSLRSDPEDMTANLQGPIIVNSGNMYGRQIVLKEGLYATKHKLFPELQTAQ